MDENAEQPTIDTKALRALAEKTPTSVMVPGNNGPIRIPNYVEDTLLALLDAYDAATALRVRHLALLTAVREALDRENAIRVYDILDAALGKEGE